MEHCHQHHPQNYNLIFGIGVLLNVAFVVIEAVFGILANSMALLADAGHNLSDVLGLLMAWGANFLSAVQPTHKKTYGLRSTTIIAALLNALFLFVTVGGIAWESIRRIYEPSPVASKTVIIIAAIGVIINTATALLFMAGRKTDLNIRGAFLHMAADAGVSAGVVVAGIGIALTGWVIIDPSVSLIIAAMILIGTWGLFRESLNLTFHGVPTGISTRDVYDYLRQLPGVTAVHDLHIWAMSTKENALTAHLVKPVPENDDALLVQIRDELHDKFGVEHVTIQLERSEAFLQCANGCEPKDIVNGCRTP